MRKDYYNAKDHIFDLHWPQCFLLMEENRWRQGCRAYDDQSVPVSLRNVVFFTSEPESIQPSFNSKKFWEPRSCFDCTPFNKVPLTVLVDVGITIKSHNRDHGDKLIKTAATYTNCIFY